MRSLGSTFHAIRIQFESTLFIKFTNPDVVLIVDALSHHSTNGNGFAIQQHLTGELLAWSRTTFLKDRKIDSASDRCCDQQQNQYAHDTEGFSSSWR